MDIKGILLDIEGTVGSIDFVHNVLFPYSQERVLKYLQKNPPDPDLITEIQIANEEDFNNGKFPKILDPTDLFDIHEYLQFLIREDRKFGPLKQIQGKIWKEGFEQGNLRSEIFEDVPLFFEKARANGYRIFIFSSGSREAQQLFFQYSIYGDLTRYIEMYFDTTIGTKQSSQSYTSIAREVGLSPSQIGFFTDIVLEADASKQAGIGMQFILERPGNRPQPAHNYPTLRSLLSFFQ